MGPKSGCGSHFRRRICVQNGPCKITRDVLSKTHIFLPRVFSISVSRVSASKMLPLATSWRDVSRLFCNAFCPWGGIFVFYGKSYGRAFAAIKIRVSASGGPGKVAPEATKRGPRGLPGCTSIVFFFKHVYFDK